MSRNRKMKHYNNYDCSTMGEKEIYYMQKDERKRNIRQARWDKRAIRNLY